MFPLNVALKIGSTLWSPAAVHMGRRHRYTQTQGVFLPNFGLVPNLCKAQSALNCIVRARSRVPMEEEMNRITIGKY